MDRLLQHMASNTYVDIFGIVYQMRMHRVFMVQTEVREVDSMSLACGVYITSSRRANPNRKDLTNSKLNTKDNRSIPKMLRLKKIRIHVLRKDSTLLPHGLQLSEFSKSCLLFKDTATALSSLLFTLTFAFPHRLNRRFAISFRVNTS